MPTDADKHQDTVAVSPKVAGFPIHDERAVAQRFEAKYIITEHQALAIKDFIEPHVRGDIHGNQYHVTSLYLDSPNLRMFQSSSDGEKNRYKLRIRGYDALPDSPVFFEIKQRVDQVIRKYRAAVSRWAVEDVLSGRNLTHDVLAKPENVKAISNLLKFRDLMERMSATPRVTVRYHREAYVSDREEPVRITFDRHLECLPSLSYEDSIWKDGHAWRKLNVLPVILEIKFTDQFPFWVSQVIRRFNLLRDSFAKYVFCVRSLKTEGIEVRDSQPIGSRTSATRGTMEQWNF